MTLFSRIGALAYLTALIVAGFDLLSKSWVVGAIDWVRRSTLTVWGPLRLTLVHNGGVSFGLLQGDGGWGHWALVVFEAAVIAFLAVWVRNARRPLSGLAVGLIMGGAFGNMLDRLRFGYVVDFIDVQRLYFPWVFNLADSAITIGVALLLAENLFSPEKPGV
jgi:signal peptidase II